MAEQWSIFVEEPSLVFFIKAKARLVGWEASFSLGLLIAHRSDLARALVGVRWGAIPLGKFLIDGEETVCAAQPVDASLS